MFKLSQVLSQGCNTDRIFNRSRKVAHGLHLVINLHKNAGWFALIMKTKFLSVKTITPTSATLVDWAPSMSGWTTPEVIQIGTLKR